MKKLLSCLKNSYLGLVLVFLYAPIFTMIAFSFSSGKSRANWGGFTFDWYIELFNDAQIMEALYYTVIVAVLAALIATVLGTIAAIGLHGLSGTKTQSVIMGLSYIPMLNPDIVTGISLMLLFIVMQLDLGFVTMLLAHITFDLPYVIMSIMPRFQQMNPNLYEAALDLGATPFQAVQKVILPEIKPGIVSGLIMAFTLSIDDFVISFFTTSGIQNLSIFVYSSARRGIEPTVYALMSIMFFVVLALVLLTQLSRPKDKKHLSRR